MSFLRRAPAIKLDRTRVDLGSPISMYVATGLNDASGNCNVFIYIDGTMSALASKNTSGGSISGTFTNRKWKYNNLAASNYYVKANNINVALGGTLIPVQSSGTIGNWTQISSTLNWGAGTTGSDEGCDFQLHISNSPSGVPVLDSVNVSMYLQLTGIGGGGNQ